MITSRVVLAMLVVEMTVPVCAQMEDRYPVRQLTTSMDQEGFPTWSPDGKTIVFENVEWGHFGLFTVPPQGGNPARLTSFIGEHPKYSPDGKYLVFDADTGNSIKLMCVQGGMPVRIVPESIPIFRGGNPVWSPDGSRIAFKADSSVWILEIEHGKATRFFQKPDAYPIPTCWARDGKSLLVLLLEGPSRRSKVVRLYLDGKSRDILPPVEGKTYRYAVESPDGSLLAFAWCEGRNCDLWAAPADGGTAVQLTMHPAYDDSPAWSPDGRKLAFTSARTGRMDIYVMDIGLEDLRLEIQALNE